MNPKWSSRFELKPGRWVFVPTPEAIADGHQVKKQLEALWAPPDYYYHLRKGGHVAALKSHMDHNSFLHLDIQDFFGNINRTRVTRCLKPKVGYKLAREWATESTVAHPTDISRFIIPYGFVQSQLIAALCLSESALGICLDKIRKNGSATVSVYVDDIVVSTNDPELSLSLFALLKTAAARARFSFNADKEQAPASQVTAFNIQLSNNQLSIEGVRLNEFSLALAQATSDAQRLGILSYIASVNADQGNAL